MSGSSRFLITSRRRSSERRWFSALLVAAACSSGNGAGPPADSGGASGTGDSGGAGGTGALAGRPAERGGSSGSAAGAAAGASGVAGGASAGAPGGQAGASETACTPRPVTTTLEALLQTVNEQVRNRAGASSGAFMPPPAAERDDFARAVLAAWDPSAQSAPCELPSSYRVLRAAVGSGTALVVVEADAAGAVAQNRYWGTYVAREGDGAELRPLVVEAPHPNEDANTWKEATDLFVRGAARYLLMSGAHRCSSMDASPCSGTTTSCGPAAPFRQSDVAHAVSSPFHGVHAALSDRDANLRFVQLHGEGGSGACPDVLVSDSSNGWGTTSFAAAIAQQLMQNGLNVGRCNLDAYPTMACNLCGGTNVQARATAASPDACTRMGTSYGRFAHLEQGAAFRQVPSATNPGWTPVVDAIIAALPVGR